MQGLTVWVNVKVGRVSRSLPLYFSSGGIDMAVFGYFACTARATLSPAALAKRSMAVRRLLESCGELAARGGDGRAAGGWLGALPTLLGLVETDQRCRTVVVEGWEFLVHLVAAGDLEEAPLWKLLAAAGTRISVWPGGASRGLLAHIVPSVPYARTGIRAVAPPPCAPASRRKGKRPTIAFPEDKIFDFFVVGMKRRGGRSLGAARDADERLAADYKLQPLLYNLVLVFGCLRGSEPLHWYVPDIEYDFEFDTGAVVSIWNPVSGPAPARPDGSARNRETYLQEEFGLRPRNLASSNTRVGWKNLLLNETVAGVGQRTRVYWLLPEVGRLFWRIHGAYVRLVRPMSSPHPFYFSAWSNLSFGTPWTLDAADEAFDRVLLAIGLEPDASKGLCLHGFRHRGKRWMDEAGVSPADQQVVLHQQSAQSQHAYGKAGPIEVARILRAATSRPADAGPVAPPPVRPPPRHVQLRGDRACHRAPLHGELR